MTDSDSRSSHSIAIVEDDGEARGLIVSELALEFPGATIIEIADRESFDRAMNGAFDIVITSHELAFSDGLTVLGRVKQRNPRCPVIMFSANRSQELAIDAMRLKLDDFILKSPENLSQLRSAVRAALDNATQKVHDETIHQQIEAEIRNERNTFQALLDSQPGIVYMFDDQGRFLRWNKQLEEVSGYSSAEIGRMLPVEFIREEDRAMIVERIHEVFEKGVSQADADFLTKDGRKIPYSFTGRRVEFGGKPCLIGVGIDNSDRKRAEDDLRRSAEALRLADQRKNDFLAMLAHELRNPLGPIRNSIQILRKSRPLDAEAESLRSIIDRQVKHMARLIDDLLDVSRISRGKILLRMERMDLANVTRTTIEDHRSAFEAADMRLESTIPDAPVWIMGDATRVAQSIGNLLNNALKFTDMGGSIRISQKLNGEFATLEFVDSGIGIAPELLSQLFSPFVQGETGIDRSRGGLGLGLALVKGLVELHGGRVAVDSEGLGKGTRFQLEFPLITPTPGSLECEFGGNVPIDKAYRILIVEDNIDAADTTRMLLEISGHTVNVVNSGTVALETAHRFEAQIVICDIGLPGGMDGYAVARVLRADDRLASCYLIALSGYGQEEDQRRARQAGFDIHLTKPLDPEVLERVLQNVVPNRVTLRNPTMR